MVYVQLVMTVTTLIKSKCHVNLLILCVRPLILRMVDV